MTRRNLVSIKYPFLPTGGEVLYVDVDDAHMRKAKEYAREESLDEIMPNASLIVKNSKVIAHGANGSDYHEKYGCERVRRNIPTGQNYELCEGCHPKNHGEQKAIANALAEGFSDLKDAEIYLWGHWWCCESCWDTILANGISTVYLLKDSEILFNREHSDNIIGHQF